MKFIKNHRYTIIIILVFLLLLCLGVKLKDILMPDNNIELYGNRLNNIDEHKIDSSLYTKIKTELESKENITSVTNRVQGKIIIFTLTITDATALADAKAYGTEIVGYFSEEELDYYTIQVYVNKNDEKLNNFPIIGVKSPKSSSIVWTKDREIVESGATDEE